MFKIQLARQGQTMEQGTVVRWIKQEGVGLAIGDELYEIESEKAIISIEVTRPGRLVRILAAAGDVVPVGAMLAIAAEPGESVTVAQVDEMLRAEAPSPRRRLRRHR
jgi:pyruvate/2-oxoglutarate dehydrogenase complex dihydrolipoamide acyltransferase (E2) component